MHIDSHNSTDTSKLKLDNPVTVFWPDDIKILDKTQKYVVLGYRVNKFKIIVIDIIMADDYKSLPYPANKSILKQLTVIGCINSKSRKWNRLIEFNYELQRPFLNINETLVYFKPPVSSRLEYYSLDSITIDIFWTFQGEKEHNFFSDSSEKYSAKLHYHFNAPDKEIEMKEVLRYVNLTNYTRSLLRQKEQTSLAKMSKNVNHLVDDMFYFSLILYNLIVVRFCTFVNDVLTHPIKNVFAVPRSKHKFEKEFKERQYKKTCTVWSISILSYTFHQLNFRVKQFKLLPNQFQKLKISKIESEALIIKGTKFSPSEYIRFYNNLWLIANDIFIGLIVSNFIKLNSRMIVDLAAQWLPVYERGLNLMIHWLMNSPAGFKLNNELANFFGHLILWVLQFWKTNILDTFVDIFPLILTIIEFITKFGGITMGMAFTLDIFNILFFNIYGIYVAFTRIYCWQLHIISTLFRLFYGKKYNVLKTRVDSNNYEFDQLMVGIILFTILIYLLPTITAFYITFVMLKLGAMLVSCVLKLSLISLNHLPLVVLLLKVKNKERLPSGITIDYLIMRNDNTLNNFRLTARSLTLSEIWRSHINSLLNFNLSNMNLVHKKLTRTRNEPYKVEDVIDNWNRVKLLGIVKRVLFGQIIEDYDYKRIF